MAPRIAVALCLFASPALADGWACEAAGAWAPCPEGATCEAQPVQAFAQHTTRDLAAESALDICRTAMSQERLTAAWSQGARATDHIATPCALRTCERDPTFTPDPMRDGFDEPVCVAVRSYVCSLCGGTSPLCARVQRERPVTAQACSDTHVDLEAFVSVLEQFDTLDPGSMRGAIGELCGTTPTPETAVDPPPTGG